MTDEPNLFDELASPGITLRCRSLALALQALGPAKVTPGDPHGMVMRETREYGDCVMLLALRFETYIKGEKQ